MGQAIQQKEKNLFKKTFFAYMVWWNSRSTSGIHSFTPAKKRDIWTKRLSHSKYPFEGSSAIGECSCLMLWQNSVCGLTKILVPPLLQCHFEHRILVCHEKYCKSK